MQICSATFSFRFEPVACTGILNSVQHKLRLLFQYHCPKWQIFT